MSTYVLSSYNGGKTLYPNRTLNTAEYVKDTYEWSLIEYLKNDEKGNTNRYYRLHSNKPRTFSDFMSYDIMCPKCGQRMHPVSNAFDYHDLALYTCHCCNKGR